MASGRIGAIARAALLAMAVAVAACGIFDFDVTLATQTFSLDFGQQTGTMPAIACDSTAGACDTAASFDVDASATSGVPSQVAVTLGCDDATRQCYAVVNARAAQTVGVIQGDGLGDKIERHSLGFVKIADVGYTIPTNTLTFDVPKVDVYAGPAGSMTETDPGVALLGSTDSIAAGFTTATPLHLIVDDNNPARSVIENAIENKQDFVFIVVAAPRMNAGNPVPAGSIRIDVTPKLVVGL